MADKRISDLNALTTLADADLLVVSDASSSETKKATFQNFKNKELELEKMFFDRLGVSIPHF